MDVDIRADIKGVTRYLNKLQKKQIPFAAKNAIDDTLYGLQQEEKKEIVRQLDRPTPFTVKGIQYQKVKSKKDLMGLLFIPENRYKYLKFQIEGGLRRPANRAIGIGVSKLRRNKYGNLPRKRITALLSEPGTFSGEINGVAGIWKIPKEGKRVKNKAPKLLVLWATTATYSKRFDYYSVGNKYVKRNFKQNMEEALRYAISTAK